MFAVTTSYCILAMCALLLENDKIVEKQCF